MFFLRSLLFALLAFASLCFAVAEIRADPNTITGLEELTDIHNDESYLPEFPSIGRSIIGRADAQSTETLTNNVPASTNSIQPGGKQTYVFPSSALQGPKSTLTPFIPDVPGQFKNVEHNELRKRTGDVPYYLSLSICSQPTSNNNDPIPQLQIFMSYNNPNADGTGPGALTPQVVDGYASFSDNTSDTIFLSIEAPNVSSFTGSYTYELVISIDQYYTSYVENPTLYFVDSDNTAAMFVSGNLTQLDMSGNVDNSSVNTWKQIGPQFSVYVMNEGDTSLDGLGNSYCALKNTTQIGNATIGQKNLLVDTRFTNLSGPTLQQQFYVSGLQKGTNYLGAMGLKSNYTGLGSGQPGGGGILYNQVAFTTKTDENCQIIYDLDFCPQINYAVPTSNRTTFNRSELAEWYNNLTVSTYQNFQYALDQIACDTSSDSQYSLAVNCSDCDRAYRDWLCTVMAPRCHDYSSQKPYLHARAISQPFLNNTLGNTTSDPQFNATFQNQIAFNSSRNPAIDTEIKPGPYKELLPCGDVCNKLVRSCPAALGFGCPYNPQNYNHSYGYEVMDGNLPQCNYPGKVVGVSGALTVRPTMVALLVFGMFLLGLR